jgi:hypothetical protein
VIAVPPVGCRYKTLLARRREAPENPPSSGAELELMTHSASETPQIDGGVKVECRGR